MVMQDALTRSVKMTNGITGAAALHKTPLFLSFHVCLSRACLGKMIAFMYKWLQKGRFFAPHLNAEEHRRENCERDERTDDAG